MRISVMADPWDGSAAQVVEDAAFAGAGRVHAEVARDRAAGATEIGTQVLGVGDDRDRTRAFVGQLLTA